MDEWLTVKEVAAILRVSDATVIRRCESGHFSDVYELGTAKRRKFRIHRDCLNRRFTPSVTPKPPKPLLGSFPMIEMFS